MFRADGSVTLFPTEAEIEQMVNRAEVVMPPLSSSYFTAIPLSNALNEIAHDAEQRAWKMREALRNARLAYPGAELKLTKLYNDVMSSADIELRTRMLVNELADTIEADREMPQGVSVGTRAARYPSMDRYYTLRPVWEFINNVRKAFKRSDS